MVRNFLVYSMFNKVVPVCTYLMILKVLIKKNVFEHNCTSTVLEISRFVS
jgi:hypothetical protein